MQPPLPATPLPIVPPLAPLLLACARHGIDRIDEGMLGLLALRRVMSAAAGRQKRALGRPLSDEAREVQVRQRARRLARRLKVSPDTADGLASLLFTDALRQQDAHAVRAAARHAPSVFRQPCDAPMTRSHALLRLIPPPARWRPLLHLAPAQLRDRVVARALTQALSPGHIGSALDEIDERGRHVWDARFVLLFNANPAVTKFIVPASLACQRWFVAIDTTGVRPDGAAIAAEDEVDVPPWSVLVLECD